MKTIEELSRTEIEHLISEWVHNSRNRNIARSKLLDGLTYEKISESYELSVNQTKNIVQKVKEILLIHVEEGKCG